MTDLGPILQRRYHVGILSVLRRCLWAAVVWCGIAGGASADAWSAFETRCLAAFETFETPDVQGVSELTMDENSKLILAAGPQARLYALAEGRTLFFDPRPDWDAVRFCSVSSVGVRDANLSGFGTWIQSQISRDLYEELDGAPGRQVYETVNWIEPRLRLIVTMATHGGPVTFGIVETDLEA